jgi:hypothetical protein
MCDEARGWHFNTTIAVNNNTQTVCSPVCGDGIVAESEECDGTEGCVGCFCSSNDSFVPNSIRSCTKVYHCASPGCINCQGGEACGTCLWGFENKLCDQCMEGFVGYPNCSSDVAGWAITIQITDGLITATEIANLLMSILDMDSLIITVTIEGNGTVTIHFENGTGNALDALQRLQYQICDPWSQLSLSGLLSNTSCSSMVINVMKPVVIVTGSSSVTNDHPPSQPISKYVWVAIGAGGGFLVLLIITVTVAAGVIACMRKKQRYQQQQADQAGVSMGPMVLVPVQVSISPVYSLGDT